MLIHTAPRLLDACVEPLDVQVIDLAIPELDLHLVGGKDITCRRPYPNKAYSVVCRKKGRKAINGLLIKTSDPIDRYTVVTRWRANGVELEPHKVTCQIIDDRFDAVTDKSRWWGGFNEGDRKWPARTPKDETRPPVERDPYMRVYDAYALYGQSDLLVDHRHRVFALPTIEPERLEAKWVKRERAPDFAEAFNAEPLAPAVVAVNKEADQ